MAAFNYSIARPAFRSPILSSQLTTLYGNIKDHFDSINALGLTLPTSVASAAQYDALLLNSGKTGFDFAKVIRSDASVSLTGAGSLAQGDILYFNGTVLTRLTKGTTGQVLRAGASAPEYATLSVALAWTAQTGNFSIADKGRYQVNGGQTGTLFVASSVDNEFYIKPAIGQNFETSSFTVARAGSESIANAAADFVCDINAEYHFVADASGNWDVSVSVIGRS